MATWEWALDNPERFAAISPRAGVGEPFRAGRLKHVPAWVIHGANDNIIPSGFSDQMVAALQSCAASVRYSILKGGEHNMPDDLDEGQVVDWYLRQTRSHEATPADPLSQLGLNAMGFSAWETIAVSGGTFWQSDPVEVTNQDAIRQAAQSLFQRVHASGELADAPLIQKRAPKTNVMTLWLATPKPLRLNAAPDPAATIVPPARYVRFYFRGPTAKALAHLTEIAAEVEAAGHHLADAIWITPLTIRPETETSVAEYRVQLQ
jgi:hypothetical protein